METTGFEIRAAEHGSELRLAMQRLWLTGQVLPVGARLLVRHVFRNGEDQPLEVVYGFMLPRDAALRRFEVEGDGFEAHSELRRVEEAVKAYEQGIDAGHLATLARSYRDGVVNLTLGNLRKGEQVAVMLEILAGVELHDDGLRFRFPFTLAPGYHPRAKVVDAGGVGELELPEGEFGDVILPRFKRDPDGLHEIGFDLALRIPGPIAAVGSPSHAIRVRDENGARRVTLAPASDVPNRDLVLDVRVSEPRTQVLAGEGRFAIVVPSTRFGHNSSGPRKIAIVIDRSGSMSGQPMVQAKRAVEACLGSLSEDDRFALVAFDNQVETFRQVLSPATTENRAAARKFLDEVQARGGTELARGFSAGARLVAGGGDVLVITDGQVLGTEEILAQARALSVRIHCLGIGSASQDRFLALLASTTGGVSRFVTAQERVDVAAVDLFASIGRPVAVDVHATGAKFGSEPAGAVFAGTPWIAFGEAAGAEVQVTWPGGSFAESVSTGQQQPEVGDTLRLLDGARRIADLESRMAPGAEKEIEPKLIELSEQFGLASRAMALVGVVKRAGDQPGAPPQTRVVPVGMPQGTNYGSYFSPAPPSPGAPVATMAMMTAPALNVRRSVFRREPPPPPPDDTDRLLEIAATLAPDGGLPGGDTEDRALKTIAALLFFLAKGHTPVEGAFRAHVERMVRFLEGLSGLSHGDIVSKVTAFARAGKKPKTPRTESWEDIAAAVS
jgi:Ca-activated chloride channel family protein